MASAIVVPEEARDATPDTNGNSNGSSNGLKRRNSEESDHEQESKRQRTSPGKSSPAAPTADVPHEDQKQPSETPPTTKTEDGRDVRKKKSVAEEKQRSKRLFGALLGNLNRPSDRNATRRAEIEQRRKAELQKQDDERFEDKQKRQEKLAIHRTKEQIKVDEQNMHIRHKQLLSNANFLQTRAEPKIYYKPWELLRDEEDRIEDQIRDAEKQIDKELDAWDVEKRRRLNKIEGRPVDDEPQRPVTASNTAKEDDADQANLTKNGDANHEEKTEPADTEDVTKPAEVPESDQGPHGSSPVEESVEKAEGTISSDLAETTSGAEKTNKEESKDDHDDDGDHVVEGDEDTVIY